MLLRLRIGSTGIFQCNLLRVGPYGTAKNGPTFSTWKLQDGFTFNNWIPFLSISFHEPVLVELISLTSAVGIGGQTIPPQIPLFVSSIELFFRSLELPVAPSSIMEAYLMKSRRDYCARSKRDAKVEQWHLVSQVKLTADLSSKSNVYASKRCL
jgi:hypothetical protein